MPKVMYNGVAYGEAGYADDYDVLANKPSINGVTLSSNITSSELGLIDTSDLTIEDDYVELNSGQRVYMCPSMPTGSIPIGAFWIGGTDTFIIDAILSSTSTNPVQNKVVTEAIGDIASVIQEVL